MEVVIS